MPLPEGGKPYDWQIAAEECLETLKKRQSHQKLGTGELMAFFKSFESKKSSYELAPKKMYPRSTELICQAGLASALLSYAASGPNDADIYRDLGLKVAATLHNFHDPKEQVFHNTYPPKGEEWERGVVDTWYMFNNLYHVLKTAELLETMLLRHLSADQ